MNAEIDALIAEAVAPGIACTRAAARLMTLAESGSDAAVDLLGRLASAPEPGMVIGLTGSPGSGKSSLVDRLLQACRAKRTEARMGVIAVDPSSPFTNGAFLGDRVRMMRHANDPSVFIRSAATRGHLGGLAAGVFGIMKVMGLAGCDIVFIETVGVGQMEIEVEGLADLVMVVLAPGQGDAMQFLKAGVMETGDVFVVNKADSARAGEFHAQLSASLRLGDRGNHPLDPEAVRLVSARDNQGIAELVDYLDQRRCRDAETWTARRHDRLTRHLRTTVLEQAQRRLEQARRRLEAEWNAAVDNDQFDRVLRGEAALAELSGELLRRAAGREMGGRKG